MIEKNKNRSVAFFWFVCLAFVGTLICKYFYFANPSVTERVFSNGLYPHIRLLAEKITHHINFPLMLLHISAVLIWFVIGLRQFFSKKYDFSFLKALRNLSMLLMIHYVLFFWLWGFNYQRIPLVETAQIDLDYAATANPIVELSDVADSLRWYADQQVAFDTTVYKNKSEILDAEKRFLTSLGYTHLTSPDYTEVVPKGLLLHLQTAGIYWPFTFQSNIDKGLHPIVKPFTIAHELAHAFGFGDEGVCNFIAYQTCIESDNLDVKYSGHLSYLRYLIGPSKRYHREGTEYVLKHCVPESARSDIKQIIARHDQYRDFVPKLRRAVYDQYLKSNGVSSGVISYSDIVKYSIAYKQKQNGLEPE